MTDLILDGKYDARGKRVDPLRGSLPFQTKAAIGFGLID
jgi:hypothetical protein